MSEYTKGFLADLFVKQDNFDAELDDLFKKSKSVATENVTEKATTEENKSKVNDENKQVEEEEEEEEVDSDDSEAEFGVVTKKVKKNLKPGKNDEEIKKRTIFVGNVSVDLLTKKEEKKQFIELFSQFGKIESYRFRSLALEKQMNRKAAFISKKLNTKRSFMNAYIIYKEIESIEKSLSLNGTMFLNKHLRVDNVTGENKEFSPKRTVFVGNLNFEIEDEPLWEHFSSCGKVEAVRVVRDPVTNLGKGFAYILFEDPTSVPLAIKLNATQIEGRKLRISRIKKQDKEVQKNKRKAKGELEEDKFVVIEGERTDKKAKKLNKPKRVKGKRNDHAKNRSKTWKKTQKK
ncbi:hypothetical protein K502DRAFT_365823 [Neoconidiobolus thromboides FSU 785]|nr:hypothetical protein K502DRAFT_365823 [Neoconidiobolus thromboides FSU 785]